MVDQTVLRQPIETSTIERGHGATAARIDLPDTPTVKRPRRIVIDNDGVARKVGTPHFTSANASAAQTTLYDHDTEYDRIISTWTHKEKEEEFRRWKKRRGEPVSLDSTSAEKEPFTPTAIPQDSSTVTLQTAASPTPRKPAKSSQPMSAPLLQQERANLPAATTPKTKRTTQDRLHSELNIDGTSLLLSGDRGDVEVCEYDGKMYTFRGDEPAEWLTKRSKISPSKSRSNTSPGAKTSRFGRTIKKKDLDD